MPESNAEIGRALTMRVLEGLREFRWEEILLTAEGADGKSVRFRLSPADCTRLWQNMCDTVIKAVAAMEMEE